MMYQVSQEPIQSLTGTERNIQNLNIIMYQVSQEPIQSLTLGRRTAEINR